MFLNFTLKDFIFFVTDELMFNSPITFQHFQCSMQCSTYLFERQCSNLVRAPKINYLGNESARFFRKNLFIKILSFFIKFSCAVFGGNLEWRDVSLLCNALFRTTSSRTWTIRKMCFTYHTVIDNKKCLLPISS